MHCATTWFIFLLVLFINYTSVLNFQLTNFSNRIANNYTPSSKGLRIHSLKQPYVPERAPPSPRKRQRISRSKTAGPRLVKTRSSTEAEPSVREYCKQTQAALAVDFPPYTTPTFGLPRSAIPIEPCLNR